MKLFIAICIVLLVVSFPVIVLDKKTIGNIAKLIFFLILAIVLFIAYVMTK